MSENRITYFTRAFVLRQATATTINSLLTRRNVVAPTTQLLKVEWKNFSEKEKRSLTN